MAFCTQCGKPLTPGQKFCTNCGKPTPRAVAAPPPPTLTMAPPPVVPPPVTPPAPMAPPPPPTAQMVPPPVAPQIVTTPPTPAQAMTPPPTPVAQAAKSTPSMPRSIDIMASSKKGEWVASSWTPTLRTASSPLTAVKNFFTPAHKLAYAWFLLPVLTTVVTIGSYIFHLIGRLLG